MQRHVVLMTGLAVSAIPATASAVNVPLAVAAYEKQLADACREAGGTPGKPTAAFIAHGDLNGDGIDDWAVDEGGLNCKGAASIFAGSGGSQVIVFVGLPNGDARKAFQHGAYGMKLEVVGSSQTLWLRVGGPLCGQAGSPTHAEAMDCDRPIAWGKEHQRFDFAPLTSIRIPGRISGQ